MRCARAHSTEVVLYNFFYAFSSLLGVHIPNKEDDVGSRTSFNAHYLFCSSKHGRTNRDGTAAPTPKSQSSQPKSRSRPVYPYADEERCENFPRVLPIELSDLPLFTAYLSTRATVPVNMIWIAILFIAPFAAGQFKDIVFAGGQCMQKCAQEMGDLSEIADPKNIEKIVRDLDKICGKYQTAEACASSCPEEEKKQFEVSTTMLSYTCIEKKDTLNSLTPCIMEHSSEAITACDGQCGSLDSLLNPGTFVDFMTQIEGMGPTCTTLKCTIRCLKQDFNTRCPGAGDLIRDIAIKQVEVEQLQLNSDMNNKNNTHAEHLVRLLRHLPSDCAFVMEADHFRETVDATNEVEPTQVPPQETPVEHPEEHAQGNQTSPETNDIQPGQALTKTSVNLIASVFTLFFVAMIALV